MPDEYDSTTMKQVQEYANHLVEINTARNNMFDSLERAYLMEWGEEQRLRDTVPNVKITRSPDMRNKIMGAVRLLIATDPAFSIPEELNTSETMEIANKLEKAIDRTWKAASGVRGDPIHFDAVFSMIMFSELHIAITKTSDLVTHAKGASRAAQIRAEQVASRTPYIFDIWHPKTGYPEFDNLGLRAFYREVETTSGAVLDEFGDRAQGMFPDSGRYSPVTICHFWDNDLRCSWIKGNERPLIAESHGLPFIPIVCQLGEGSMMFEKPEHKRQPFGYTLWKSGLWERQNLSLTVLYTLIFTMGNAPMFAYRRNDMDKQLEIDHSVPGGVAYLDPGEEFTQVQKNTVDPALLQGLEIADKKAGESTIYGQTLGEPLGGNAPYSMVALLHQAGRLPLVVPQRKAQWALGEAARIAMRWMREEAPGQGLDYTRFLGDLIPQDIPDTFEVSATLEINLPQDELQNAQAANIVSQGDDPLVSRKHAREKYLNIRQPEEMTKEIWDERAANLKAMQYFLDMMQKVQMQMQQVMTPQPPPGMAPGQPGMPPGQPGMPPGQPGMPPGQPGPGPAPMGAPPMGPPPGMMGENGGPPPEMMGGA